jgi:arylsulfatase
VVAGKDAPQICATCLPGFRQYRVRAGANGVVVAQGGKAHGFALFVQDGKLSLALRVKRELTVIAAQKSIEPGKRRVGARLAADGKVTLTVDDQVVGEGQATLLGAQPGEGLTIGSDGNSAVGEYASPNDFKGTVAGATVKVL